MLPTKFRFIWPSGCRGEHLKNWPIRNKYCLWRPSLLMNGNKMCNLYREPFIDASYQVTVHFAKQFHWSRFYKSQPISNENCLWRSCLLTDKEEMSIPYRGLSIDASYQVTVHLAKQFQRRRFYKNQHISNKNCLWRACLLTDKDEMSNISRELP